MWSFISEHSDLVFLGRSIKQSFMFMTETAENLLWPLSMAFSLVTIE